MAYRDNPHKEYMGNRFFKIGTWNSPKGDWKVSLGLSDESSETERHFTFIFEPAVPLPSKNPFSQYQAPSLKLVVSYVFPDNLDIIEVKINSVIFSIGQMGEAGQHTLQPTSTAFQTDYFKFTREVNVQGKPTFLIKLYIHSFLQSILYLNSRCISIDLLILLQLTDLTLICSTRYIPKK